MNVSKLDFLRRTLFAASALAALALAAPSQAQTAQTITLTQGASTLATCTLNGAITVTPSGGLTIPCTSSTTNNPPPPPPPPPPVSTTGATFNVSAPISVTLGSTNTATTITRTGGDSGTHYLVYAISGSGCLADQSTLTFAANGATAQIPITPVAANLPCSVAVTGTDLDETVNLNSSIQNTSTPWTATASVTVVAAGSSQTTSNAGGTQIPAGCATPAANWKDLTLPAGGSPMQLRMTSGQIASFPVVSANDPNLGLPSTNSEVTFTQGQQPATPGGVITEIQVSKCPGTINPAATAPQCYSKSSPGAVQSNGIPIILRPNPYISPPWVDQASAAALGGCWAADGQQYFVNVRWTYNSCPFTASGGCGFSEQWQTGPF